MVTHAPAQAGLQSPGAPVVGRGALCQGGPGQSQSGQLTWAVARPARPLCVPRRTGKLESHLERLLAGPSARTNTATSPGSVAMVFGPCQSARKPPQSPAGLHSAEVRPGSSLSQREQGCIPFSRRGEQGGLGHPRRSSLGPGPTSTTAAPPPRSAGARPRPHFMSLFMVSQEKDGSGYETRPL